MLRLSHTLLLKNRSKSLFTFMLGLLIKLGINCVIMKSLPLIKQIRGVGDEKDA